nr:MULTISPECIES: protein-methionine-sulfoxide reductase heme-binding subunit MsrQ [Shewanella]
MKLTPKRLGWLKFTLHVLCFSPIAYLVYLVLTDSAGGDPVQYLIHFTGMGGLNTLVATLLVSPLAKWLKMGALLQTRRLLGLYVFAYACLHIGAFISLDLLFEWTLLFEEVIKRPYILLGASGFIILCLLAVTSFKQVKTAMGKRWLSLHRSIYLLALLVPIHFYWSVKSEIIEPSIYVAIFAGLLWLRKKQIKQILLRR